jgi:hypothetical protein
VHDRPVRRVILLRAGMRALPVALRLPPQGLQRQAQTGWRLSRPGRGAKFAKAAPKNYRFRAVVSARSYNSIPGGMRHP